MQPADIYPVDLSAEYGDGTRSRVYGLLGILWLPKVLLLIPHVIVLYVIMFAAQVIGYIGYWAILITGDLPEFFHKFPERALAWNTRIAGWLLSLTDAYPPFEWEPRVPHVDLQVSEPPGPRSRVIALLGVLFIKGIALIPHVFVLVFVMFGSFIATWVGYWAILFTGRLPQGIFTFTHGAMRWSVRLQAWAYSLTDQYPPFSLSR